MTSIRSIRGLFTLNVRSTPTPLAIRRTVIERVIPPPRRRMTTPSKTWIRSRLPSTTLALTRTVSPAASSGRSVRSWSATISSSTFTRVHLHRSPAGGCGLSHGEMPLGARVWSRSARPTAEYNPIRPASAYPRPVRDREVAMGRVTSLDGSPIAFDRMGSGPSVVLVHAGFVDRRSCLLVAHELASRFTVVLVDRRGRGDSGPYREDHRIEREFEDVAAIVGALGGPVTLVGHSSSAWYVLYGARLAGGVHRLVLYEPPPLW